MVFAETCPQYLFLSLDDLGNGFEGAKYVCSPPLRPKDHQEDLWRGLRTDDLQLVGTDHCPFDFEGQKELGRGDFRKIPNGLPAVEDRVDLLHDGGVVGGRISRERWVEIMATAPAKMFGMYPKKGAIAVGSDADILVYDPNRKRDDQRRDAPHGRRLLDLRGVRGPGRVRRGHEPGHGPGSRRRVGRPGRPRAVPPRAGQADHARLRVARRRVGSRVAAGRRARPAPAGPARPGGAADRRRGDRRRPGWPPPRRRQMSCSALSAPSTAASRHVEAHQAAAQRPEPDAHGEEAAVGATERCQARQRRRRARATPVIAAS